MKKKPYIVIAALALLSAQTELHAEVFKCKTADAKTVYQPTPCTDAAVVTPIEIKKRSAEQEAAAAEALKHWQDKHDTEEAAKIAARKAAHEEKLREAEVSAAQRNAAAQIGQEQALNEQAAAQRRQAAALEKSNEPNSNSVFIRRY